MKGKRAVSLSMNTIIVAALAIIVLIILIYLVMGAASDTDTATSCSRKGGVCKENGCDPDSIHSKSLGQEYCESGYTCCVPEI